MNKALGVAGLAVLTMTLSACESFFSNDTSFANIQDLRHAVLDADTPCPGNATVDTVGAGETILKCNEDLTLRWYTEDEEIAKAVAGLTLSPSGKSFLTGQNWIAQGATSQLIVLQESLGGQITDYEK